ncbi:MAG: PAAR domain-containing protein [Caldilineaceae bacterium]|nr:PAAR domain-containing protein [Caldilineaceae bacterium]
MGKPAARMGDMTAHGGVITAGCPTVLIGGMAAARVGDDHTCPMSDGPKPHKGGPIMPPGSVTVMIGGMPAARMGDQAVCVGPVDAIAGGLPTVLIG